MQDQRLSGEMGKQFLIKPFARAARLLQADQTKVSSFVKTVAFVFLQVQLFLLLRQSFNWYLDAACEQDPISKFCLLLISELRGSHFSSFVSVPQCPASWICRIWFLRDFNFEHLNAVFASSGRLVGLCDYMGMFLHDNTITFLQRRTCKEFMRCLFFQSTARVQLLRHGCTNNSIETCTCRT